MSATIATAIAANRPSAISRSALLWNGSALAVGALGVVATSVFYLLSPPAAVMPLVPLDLHQALGGAAHGATTMHIAGTIGTLSDVIIAAAAFSIGAAEVRRGGFSAGALGWMAIAISGIIFISVDTLVGFVLGRIALAPGSADAFLGFKILFDALFALGTFAFGIGGALALMAYVRERGAVSRAIAWPALLLALIGAIAGIASLLGFDAHNFMGASIGGGALLFALIGAQLARAAIV